MRRTLFRAIALTFPLALVAGATTVEAQPLARRLAAIGKGTVELRYATRAGVCGDGRTYYSMGGLGRIVDGGVRIRGWKDGDFSPCVAGPARVRMRVTNGVVNDVRVFVGPSRDGAPDTDLGVVASADAAELFLRMAETGDGGAAHGAITAAILADSASVWRRLLAIARDSANRSHSIRHDALFWVGRFAAAKTTGGDAEDLTRIVDDDDDRDDPRNSAIFALSQLKNHEGVPSLLQIARTHRDPALRRQALFWLGESGDPRGVALFEDILRR